mgnify:CR=1 FL=1
MNNNITSITKKTLWQIILVDILLLLIIYFVPTISHLTSFPIYLLDPMRLVVLGSIVFVNDKRNSYILAVTIPIFSFFVSGHPILYKNLIISIELLTNVYLYNYLITKNKHVFLSALGSIVISKSLYYILKSALIYFSVLNTSLFDTSIAIQIVVTILISVILSLTHKKLS